MALGFRHRLMFVIIFQGDNHETINSSNFDRANVISWL